MSSATSNLLSAEIRFSYTVNEFSYLKEAQTKIVGKAVLLPLQISVLTTACLTLLVFLGTGVCICSMPKAA